MLITDELIEKMARAICAEQWSPAIIAANSTAWMGYRSQARAALSIAAREITEACAKVAEHKMKQTLVRRNSNMSNISSEEYQRLTYQYVGERDIASAIRALAREG